MNQEFRSNLHRAALVFGLLIGSVFVFSLRDASAQRGSLFDDGGYCPATQHSCDFTQGTVPYFPPDPFDVGAACDRNFLSYTDQWGSNDLDGNGIDDRSCYGRCDLNGYNTGDYSEECYVNCQSGGDGMSGYVGCLRGAFGVNRNQLTPLGGSSTAPRNPGVIAGNILRSCLAGTVPSIYQDQYDNCIAAGGTVEQCCIEVANNFP